MFCNELEWCTSTAKYHSWDFKGLCERIQCKWDAWGNLVAPNCTTHRSSFSKKADCQDPGSRVHGSAPPLREPYSQRNGILYLGIPASHVAGCLKRLAFLVTTSAEVCGARRRVNYFKDDWNAESRLEESTFSMRSMAVPLHEEFCCVVSKKRGSIFGSGAIILDGRSRIRTLIRSLDFSQLT
jgi:hypothetical protein